MARLTMENKRELIRLYVEGKYGKTELSRIFNVRLSNVKELVRKYELHGESIFVKDYRTYDPSFKLEILNRYFAGESKSSLSIEYNIKHSMIMSWLKRYEENGYNGLIDKLKGRRPLTMKKKVTIDNNLDSKEKEIQELKQRNLELEAEVEALKKLRALVQQRNAQQQRKKQ